MDPRLRNGAATALTALALWLGGCAGTTARNPFATASAGEQRIRVTVENQNFGDATVHALRGGARIRLGTVTGKSEETFNVRWTYTLPMAFEVHVVGGQSCRVRPIHVDPGDRVWVRIPTHMSSQSCYAGKG